MPTAGMQYQLFPDLRAEEYEALKADIAKRGVLVPIEYDQAGNLLDGHHRLRIAAELGIDVPKVTRFLKTDDERIAHVIALNLKRRHLDPVSWGEMFLRYAEARGVRLGHGKGDPSGKTDNVSVLSGELGVNERTARRRVEAARDLPEDVKEQVRSGELPLHAAKERHKRAKSEKRRGESREHNRDLVETTPPLTYTGGTYQTIAIDPPWDFGDEGDWDPYGRSRPTYHQMPFAEIKALDVPGVAAENAHIYLWITNRSLPKGFELLEEWGFRYVTAITWGKPSFGMGQYFRGQTEHVLFGVRGSLPLLRADAGTILLADRPKRHSEKPPEFYELVESCSPGPWLEVFSRSERPGWVTWGAEVPVG